MNNPSNYPYQPQLTVREAREILGTTSKGLSDTAIERLIAQVDILTDIVVSRINDSIYHSAIEITTNEVDNNG